LRGSDTSTFHATAPTVAIPTPMRPALGTRTRVKFFNEGRPADDDEPATLLLLVPVEATVALADDIVRAKI
jgi:hypothetical protein